MGRAGQAPPTACAPEAKNGENQPDPAESECRKTRCRLQFWMSCVCCCWAGDRACAPSQLLCIFEIKECGSLCISNFSKNYVRNIIKPMPIKSKSTKINFKAFYTIWAHCNFYHVSFLKIGSYFWLQYFLFIFKHFYKINSFTG